MPCGIPHCSVCSAKCLLTDPCGAATSARTKAPKPSEARTKPGGHLAGIGLLTTLSRYAESSRANGLRTIT